MSLSLQKIQDPHRVDQEDEEEDDEEEEEALSLCDLPVSAIITRHEDEEEDQRGDNFDFDFDFDLGFKKLTVLESPEMCAADEVFSGGQILPFRLTGFPRSESIGSGSGSMFTSSRSSSTRSHYSTTTSSTASSSSKPKPKPKPKPKAQAQFHSYPSPKPQIRAVGPYPTPSSYKKSRMWEVLRLGLIQTPEIELRDLKIRHSTSRNTNNDIQYYSVIDKTRSSKSHQDKFGGIFGSCKCSFEVIEPRPMNNLLGHNQVLNEDKDYLARKKQEQPKRKKHVRQGKHATSHHRTFEWLSELSHTRHPSNHP